MRTIVDAAKEAGISAVIAADVAVMKLCPSDRAGGTSFHPVEYLQCGSFEVLCTICGCSCTGS